MTQKRYKAIEVFLDGCSMGDVRSFTMEFDGEPVIVWGEANERRKIAQLAVGAWWKREGCARANRWWE